MKKVKWLLVFSLILNVVFIGQYVYEKQGEFEYLSSKKLQKAFEKISTEPLKFSENSYVILMTNPDAEASYLVFVYMGKRTDVVQSVVKLEGYYDTLAQDPNQPHSVVINSSNSSDHSLVFDGINYKEQIIKKVDYIQTVNNTIFKRDTTMGNDVFLKVMEEYTHNNNQNIHYFADFPTVKLDADKGVTMTDLFSFSGLTYGLK